MILNIIRKLLPLKVKYTISTSLRKELCPPATQVLAAGKPGSPNLWWNELELAKNHKIFPSIRKEAKNACAEIRDAYRPVLLRYGVDDDNFFWGSIKNEEAEALYQLILERKPKIVYQIGTFVGYSALVIAHALRANGEGLLVAVDPEIPHCTFINRQCRP
ncbi:MAG: hypothetical protein GY705_22820 [Bacteroidetes bacterium]|nr:hypothetical protein [Bacteroidota bacterium]